MAERIGIVTGGGDCPGLNAVIRAVVKAAAYRGWESVGFLGGFEGMLEPVSYRRWTNTQMGGLLFRGGTILGTSNRGRFVAKRARRGAPHPRGDPAGSQTQLRRARPARPGRHPAVTAL